MPQFGMELIFENVFSFYITLFYLLGQQIILNIHLLGSKLLSIKGFFSENFIIFLHKKNVIYRLS
jgi:hypothetical protein